MKPPVFNYADYEALKAECERLKLENERLAAHGGRYMKIAEERYEMFEKAIERAEEAESALQTYRELYDFEKKRAEKAEAELKQAVEDIKSLENQQSRPYEPKPCFMCKKIACYCSSGGSACKGFEWRGITQKEDK